MKFIVPQFIDKEDIIILNLTFKQLIYLVGGGGLSAGIFVFLGSFNPFFKVALASPPLILGVAFAFLEVNGRNFIFYVESFIRYNLNAKKYVWKKVEKKQKINQQNLKDKNLKIKDSVPKISKSKLKDLAWSLDVKEYNR